MCGSYHEKELGRWQSIWPDGTGIDNFCAAGVLSYGGQVQTEAPTIPPPGVKRHWSCGDQLCWAERVAQYVEGCGSAAKAYSTNARQAWPVNTPFCAYGDPIPANPAFPMPPNNVGQAVSEWTCQYNHQPVNCSAMGQPMGICINRFTKPFYCGTCHFARVRELNMYPGVPGGRFPADAEAFRYWTATRVYDQERYEHIKNDSNILGWRVRSESSANRVWNCTFCEEVYESSLVPLGNAYLVPNFPEQNSSRRWRCAIAPEQWDLVVERMTDYGLTAEEIEVMRGGRTSITCTAKRAGDDIPDPKCAEPMHEAILPAEKESWDSVGEEDVGEEDFCLIGDLKEKTGYEFIHGGPPFPEKGGRTEWRCVEGEHLSVECWATRLDDEIVIEPELAYDIVRGFFVVDGEVNIEFGDKDREIRDGLKVVGGIFSTGGNPSFRLRRSLQLKDNLLYPTVVIFHDARYMDIARRVLGNTFGTGEIRDIGLKE